MLSFCSKHKCSWQLQTLKLVHNFQSVFLSSTSTDEATQSFSNYLVNSLGFSHQQAALTCSKLSIKKVNYFKSYDNAKSVVNFLKSRGFDDTRVRKIVSISPIMLIFNIDKSLEPKYKLLRDLGFSESDLVRVISATPTLLVRRMGHIIVNLRDVLGSVENVKKFFSQSNLFTTSGSLENMISNIALLKNDYGINIDVIQNSILKQHASFLRNPEFFRNVVVRVEDELGIPRDSKMFFYGIRLLCSYRKKTINSKCQVLKSLGWTEDQVCELMRRFPIAFDSSEETMRKKLGFLMNELGYDPGFLVSRSALFSCSLEKRMMPRYGVLMALKHKGLLDYNFYTAILKNETNFLKIYVEPYKEDVPGLLELYQNSKICADVEALSTVMPN